MKKNNRTSNHTFRNNSLRNFNIFSLFTVLIVAALLIYYFAVVNPSFSKLLITATENDILRTTQHLRSMFTSDGNLFSETFMGEYLSEQSETLKKDLGLMKLKFYSSSGTVVFSTDPNEIGQANNERYFHEIVAKGKPHSVLVEKDTVSLEGRKVTEDVMEIYLPLITDKTFKGALEVYYIITSRKKYLDRLLVQSSGVLILLASGLLTAVLLLVFKESRTVKERIQAYRELQENEKRYRNLIEMAPDVIFSVSPVDETITSINSAFEKITGRPCDDILGRPLSDYLSHEELALARKVIREALDGRPIPLTEFTVLSASGEPLVGEFIATPETINGKIINILVFGRDITFRKKMEEALLRARQVESIGALTGGLSHDFNNILTGIMGNISLAQINLTSRKPLDEVLKPLHMSEELCIRANDLIQQLITFSTGGSPMKKVMGVSEFIKKSVRYSLKDAGIRPVLSIPDDLWRVEADEVQMGQVVHNLITNAREAMPKGGIIRVCAENTAMKTNEMSPQSPHQGSSYVKIAIQDQGVGIPEKDLHKIVNPYFTTKRLGTQKGMGLGLSIAHSIIKKHGGFLEVESKPEAGTTVIIYLPAYSEDPGPEGKALI